MPKNGKKVLEFDCIYCRDKIKTTESPSQLKVVHCRSCETTHKKKMLEAGNRADYWRYLRRVKARWRYHYLGRSKMAMVRKVFHVKDDHLFRGEVNMGRILWQNETCVCVQESPSSQVLIFQKVCIA
ncbi:MAG: hypothetical protein V1845_02430 [bacterium]